MEWELRLLSQRSSSADVLLVASNNSKETTHGLLSENSTYWWQLRGDFKSPFETLLVVNGIVLPRDIAGPNEIWFRWDLGFNAGFADVEISGIIGPPWTARLIIDPVRTKLVRQDFRLMLRDIIEDTRSLASTGGMRERLSRGKQDLPIATLEFILESSSRIHKLVTELDKNSHGRLRRSIQVVPLRNARGVTGRQWNNSRNYDAPVSAASLKRLPPHLQTAVARNGGMMPQRVQQTTNKLSKNRREHEEILGFLQSVVAELRRSMNSLASGTKRPGDAALRDRCRRAARQLAGLLDLSVFSGIAPARGQWEHSHLYQRVEPYRSLYRLHRDVKSGVSGIDGDFADIALQETFRLYETWVSLRLARAAAVIDPGLDASSMFVDRPERNKLTLSLRSTRAEFKGHALRFKPVFDEVWQTEDGIGSYSRQMIPDVVLDVFGSSTSERTLVILDAKYRVEMQLNDAIASIHMYKDALIEEGRGSKTILPGDRALVTSGFVVIPAAPVGLVHGANWREEKMPVVLFRQGYRDRFKMGAMVLRPGMDTGAIAELLSTVIAPRTGLLAEGVSEVSEIEEGKTNSDGPTSDGQVGSTTDLLLKSAPGYLSSSVSTHQPSGMPVVLSGEGASGVLT